jgi:hypothetical protein
MCADLIALSLSGGYSGGTCYYHPTSHLLVGFLEFNDTPSFCGNSFTKVAGRTPAAACSSTDALVKRVCPFEPASDGGPSDRGAPVDGGA